ncbi:MAG: polysaccharide biosynthesis C-terminal domain-containing protein, partial [Ignavibacteriales bacterium]|nr:polysaccharide biosynthesis C-terminal domain-containing protein [Ignavibacteriales bacterium]
NVTIANWNNIFGYFINGVGKIRLQFYSAIFILIVNIPLSVILVKIPSLGIAGIVIANCLVLFISSIWAPLQYYKIINGTAKGIWNK